MLDADSHTTMKLKQARFFLDKLKGFGKLRWEDIDGKRFDEFTYYLDAFFMSFSNVFNIMIREYKPKNKKKFNEWFEREIYSGKHRQKQYKDELIEKLIHARVITTHEKQYFPHTIVTVQGEFDWEEWYEFPLESGDELVDVRKRCGEGFNKVSRLVKDCQSRFEKTALR